MTHRITSYRYTFVAAAALLLSGCSTHYVKVLDATTHQPIAGVWVSYKRNTSTRLLHPNLSCEEVSVGITNLSGRVWLTVSAPFSLFRANSYATDVYLPGYEYSSEVLSQYYLRPFTGTPAKRLDQLHWLSAFLSHCDDNEESLPMLQAIAEESLSIVNHLEGAYSSGSLRVTMPIKESEELHIRAQTICKSYGNAGVMSSGYENREKITQLMIDEWLKHNSPACYSEVTRPILKAGEWCEKWDDKEQCQRGVFSMDCPDCRETFTPVDGNIGPLERKTVVRNARYPYGGAGRLGDELKMESPSPASPDSPRNKR